MTTGTIEIRHDTERERFVHNLDGDEAYVEYRMRDEETMDLRHTFVPEEHRHRGIAGAVVERALAHARANGLRVVATCPFVRSFLDEHPQYSDLIRRKGESTS
jgi:predicted GNAT family acetyltransferase